MVEFLVVFCSWAITAGIGYAIKHGLGPMIIAGSMLGVCFGASLWRQYYDLGKNKMAVLVMTIISIFGLGSGLSIAYLWDSCPNQGFPQVVGIGAISGLLNGILVGLFSPKKS